MKGQSVTRLEREAGSARSDGNEDFSATLRSRVYRLQRSNRGRASALSGAPEGRGTGRGGVGSAQQRKQ